jgi:hypothetical protein
VQRLQPQAVKRWSRGARAGRPSQFALAKILRCPTCGTALTGTRDRGGRRVRYSCRLGSVTPHQRITISEHLIMPAIQMEAERLRPPFAEVESRTRDERQRARLEGKREKVIDSYVDEKITKADRDRRLAAIDTEFAALDSRRIMLAVPSIAEIDWDDPAKVNGVLAALFEEVRLDAASFQPTAFTWRVPEWRG